MHTCTYQFSKKKWPIHIPIGPILDTFWSKILQNWLKFGKSLKSWPIHIPNFTFCKGHSHTRKLILLPSFAARPCSHRIFCTWATGAKICHVLLVKFSFLERKSYILLKKGSRELDLYLKRGLKNWFMPQLGVLEIAGGVFKGGLKGRTYINHHPMSVPQVIPPKEILSWLWAWVYPVDFLYWYWHWLLTMTL